MKNRKKINKLDKLTIEADMLTRVLDDALKLYNDKDGICEIGYLSEIIRKKFNKIRALF